MSIVGVPETQNPFGALLPEQFGKYSLLGHLATGGMAEVWLARKVGVQGFEKIVVIKRARPELTDAATTQYFLDEARLVATLEHPNIAQVYENGIINGSYFFVMEYIDGPDLRRLIEAALARRQRIPLGAALYIIAHVCTALHYAHEKHDLEGRPLNLIHRDVSPSNVLLSHEGAVKVCDFGIAKAHNRRTRDTQAGVLKGKFSYMSPEQIQSKPVDRRSDVFSIGILLYELTTLSKLFRGAGDFARIQKIAEQPIEPPSTRVRNYPPELEAIVMKALAKSPSERYQTAQALQVDLEAFAREHKVSMSSIDLAGLVRSMFKRHDAWIRAQRAHSDHFIEVGAAGSAESPELFADGSEQSAPDNESAYAATVLGSEKSKSSSGVSRQRPAETTPVPPASPRRRSSALWLVGAVATALVAVGVTVADQIIITDRDRAATAALTGDVERLSAVFDGAARSAHIRVDGIATTPMLRAAIETDAATLRDLASTEMIFSPGKGEAVEVYQFGSEKSVSLLRIPSTAAALPPLKGRETRVNVDGDTATLYASAPISGYKSKVAGGLVIASPVNLAPVRRALEEHSTHAILSGLGSDLVLAGSGPAPDGVAPIKLAVPSTSDWSSSGATLIATPGPAIGLPWAGQVRTIAGGLAALLVLGFVVSLVRRLRSH